MGAIYTVTNKERRREFMDYLASLADFNNFRPVFGTWWRLNSNSKSGFDDYDNPRNNPTYCENCLKDVYDWPVDYSLGGYWCCCPCYYVTNDERERKAKEARIKRGIEYPARVSAMSESKTCKQYKINHMSAPGINLVLNIAEGKNITCLDASAAVGFANTYNPYADPYEWCELIGNYLVKAGNAKDFYVVEKPPAGSP